MASRPESATATPPGGTTPRQDPNNVKTCPFVKDLTPIFGGQSFTKVKSFTLSKSTPGR
jgi:hypothetical protein